MTHMQSAWRSLAMAVGACGFLGVYVAIDARVDRDVYPWLGMFVTFARHLFSIVAAVDIVAAAVHRALWKREQALLREQHLQKNLQMLTGWQNE